MADDLHLLRIGCGGCAASWAGGDRAHCGQCHVTFDSIKRALQLGDRRVERGDRGGEPAPPTRTRSV